MYTFLLLLLPLRSLPDSLECSPLRLLDLNARIGQTRICTVDTKQSGSHAKSCQVRLTWFGDKVFLTENPKV